MTGAPNSTMTAVGLLTDVAELGRALERQPYHVAEQRERRAALEARLAAERDASVATRFLNNFAPALLDAIGKVLAARVNGDRDGEARWLRHVAPLADDVGRDAAAAIDWLAEISKSDKS